jgi:hypothetical protein
VTDDWLPGFVGGRSYTSGMPRRLSTCLAALVCLGLAAGLGTACTSKPARPLPVALTWREQPLPMPPGDPGHIAVRDAVACGGRWFVFGGVLGAGEASRPAAWVSDDAKTWRSLTPAPFSFYGKLQTLFTAACTGGRVVTAGAKSGGAHGNPRISTFSLQGDTLTEANAAFTLYGGSEQVNFGVLSAGPKGFLIAGNRVSGAAAWVSPDGTDFTIVEKSPGLASDPSVDTFADAGVVTASGYQLVGAGLFKGHIEKDPLVWNSPDGTHWSRVALARDDTYEELQRAVRVGDETVAVGLHGDTFGTWRGDGAHWQVAGRFGGNASPLASVQSATVLGRTVVVAAQDGSKYGLWASADLGQTWRTVTLPAGNHPSGSERRMAVAAAGHTLLAAGDDGAQGRVWIADYSG